MGTIISIILLLLILCIIILIHEFGHFITAKKAGVYVYEFSLGFGPKLFSFNRKNDETTYSIRAIPLGGYVSMAGETYSQEESKKVKKGMRLVDKKFLPRLIVLLAGIIMNFVLAIVILFVSSLIFGSPNTKAIIGEVEMNSPAYYAGFKSGDEIIAVNGKNIKSIEDLSLEIHTISNPEELTFKLKGEDGTRDAIVKATVTEENGKKTYKYGFTTSAKRNHGILSAFSYTFNKFNSIMRSMWKTLAYLFTGKVSVKELSGPVGIYSVVDSAKSTGIENILYLIAFLSVNVGVINLLPIPVFDGGRALLLIIERIKGGRLNEKVEVALDMIGFAIMILLMIFVTINDIFKLF